MSTVTPFTIDVPQATLDDLQARLADTRWTDEVEGAEWNYGSNLGFMKRLAHYWEHEYDWRQQEAALNELPQFQTEIDGLKVHFLHIKGKGENPMPLLLLHGWPDSFFRMVKMIPTLTDPASVGGNPADAFDLVIPSLPGFGFSDAPREGGWDTAKNASVLHRLMTDVLGYKEYGAHGGDTGSPLSQALGLAYPDHVKGIHLTDFGWHVLATLDHSTLSEAEQEYVQAQEMESYVEGAYVMIQGTKPQTLAYGLNDSPVALAAWILEKFHTWSDGDLDTAYSKDELLTNIMIYWVTQTINSSIRWYYNGMQDQTFAGGERVEVPVGMALFPKEGIPPRELAERSLNVQHWTEMERGGHFAAMEVPDLLAADLQAFFRTIR